MLLRARLCIVQALILLAFPLTAFEWAWFHGAIGTYLIGLFDHHLFWASASIFAASWSLMFTTAIVLTRVTVSPPLSFVPKALFWGASVLALVPTFIVLAFSNSGIGFGTVIIAGAGILFAYILMTAASFYAWWKDRTFVPFPTFLPALVSARTTEKSREQGATFEPTKEARPSTRTLRTFAVTNVLFVVLAFLTIALAYHPVHPYIEVMPPPGLAYLYVLIALLIWAVGFLDYKLNGRTGGMILVIGLFLLASYWPRANLTEHVYNVSYSSTPHRYPRPVEVAKNRNGQLVLVTSSGGGIWAAGWTTTCLRELCLLRNGERIIDPDEIIAVSGVSGGAVGFAHYLSGLVTALEDQELTEEEQSKILNSSFWNSTRTSLRSSIYGIAVFDFWTALLGPLALWATQDRGQLIEDKWIHVSKAKKELLEFSKLPDLLRTNKVPVPIFNATAMESGRRVMITPLDFGGGAEAGKERGRTLFEYLAPTASVAKHLDINLWTAARLSATFSYVSPAAEARITGGPDGAPELIRHHMIDGGYSENHGVASAMDFLEPILKARAAGEEGITFDRVLLIQLRGFRIGDHREKRRTNSFVSDFFGPVLGMLSIRSGQAVSRNEVELHRFIKHWNTVLEEKEVSIRTAVLEHPTYIVDKEGNSTGHKPPLSWHLTEKTKNALKNPWRKVARSKEFEEQLAIIQGKKADEENE